MIKISNEISELKVPNMNGLWQGLQILIRQHFY